MNDARTIHAPLLPLALALAIAALDVLAGCGGGGAVGKEGDVVGGPCSDGTCADGSECLVEGDFPGGTCTVRCTSQSDCPGGSWCVQENGGTCLLACEGDGDCRDGYMCESKSAMGGPSEQALVCIR